MARIAKLEPKGLGSGKWLLEIPATYSDTGKRRRVLFATKRLAEAEAGKLKREREQWGVRAKHAEPHLVTEATAAAELLRPFGVGLLEVTRQWIARRRLLDGSETVLEAVTHYLALKQAEGRSRYYLAGLRRLRHLPGAFLNRLVADVEPADVERVLAETCGGTGAMWNRRRLELAAVFGESVRRGKAAANPVGRVLVRRRAAADRIDILSVEETRRLLAACSGEVASTLTGKTLPLRECIPVVAVGLFAGLRPQECSRLLWSDVDLAERVIRLDGDRTKTRRRRHVAISDNLAAWLEPYARSEGKVAPPYWPAQSTVIRAKAGISDRRDVCRHSFGSYWLAVHRDPNELAYQMGNSPEICRKHYLEHVPRREALEYWGIAPEGVEIPTVSAVA